MYILNISITLAEIQTFKLDVEFLEEAKNGRKLRFIEVVSMRIAREALTKQCGKVKVFSALCSL